MARPPRNDARRKQKYQSNSPRNEKSRLRPAGFPAGHRRRLMVACSFLSVRKSSSPSCFQKSPERRFCISGNVIFESCSLFLENLTLFFDFGLFCCRICEKATQKCGFFSCIFFINTGCPVLTKKMHV